MKKVEKFDPSELLKYGDELEISGMLLANGIVSELILFPEASHTPITIIQPTHEEFKTLLYQLDTLGVLDLQKTVLRKSQRNIEQTISWNVFRRDNYTCQYCARNDIPLTVDHLVLWENMGESVENNLLSACKKCNKTRGNLGFDQWLACEYYQKVILNFGANIDRQDESNRLQWELAKKVPLRRTQRNR